MIFRKFLIILLLIILVSTTIYVFWASHLNTEVKTYGTSGENVQSISDSQYVLSPLDAVVDPVNHYLYVATENGSYIGFVAVVNITNDKVIKYIDLHQELSDGTDNIITVDPSSNDVFVLNSLTGDVLVIDANTNILIKNITGLGGIWSAIYDRYTNNIYVTSGKFISVINGSNNSLAGRISIGYKTQSITLDTINHDLYVALYTPPFFNVTRIAVVNVSTNKVIEYINVSSYLTLRYILFNPYNKYVYASLLNCSSVIINPMKNNSIERVNFSKNFYYGVFVNMAVNSLNGNVYITKYVLPDSYRLVITTSSTNFSSLKYATIPNLSAYFVTYDSQNNKVYVGNQENITVISGSNNTTIGTIEFVQPHHVSLLSRLELPLIVVGVSFAAAAIAVGVLFMRKKKWNRT